MKLTPIFLALALFGASLPALRARTIEWGNAVGDTLFDSNGVPLDDSYVFELGSFGIFTPTEFNVDQWTANWKIFDRAMAPAAEGWNSAFSYFSSSATMEAGGVSSESPPLMPNTFAEGEQAFIWVYNAVTFTPATEWALITNDLADGNAANDWTMPAHGDKTDLPLEWRLSDATTIIFGGHSDVQGPGSFAVDPASFELQTHVVPEPSGAVLFGLTATIAITILRRRRNR